MSKRLSFGAFALILLSLAFTSGGCLDNCRYVDCSGEDFKNILYASAQSGSDLILTNQYKLDSLKIQVMVFDTLRGGPAINVSQGPSDYNISLGTSTNTRGYILQLAGLKADTLLFINGNEESECCGNTTTIEDVILNGDTLKIPRFAQLILLK